ncbi:E3 SUMO-protein ligase ZBED1-like [Prorops nasuta]|uniref:E3 SUMO-protein ligase ZBED1-like n=1 Tax=Prorops nasuta TaxID=863751 RepID=UPI0034CE3BB7
MNTGRYIFITCSCCFILIREDLHPYNFQQINHHSQSMPPHKSIAWNYFTKVSQGAKCKFCNSIIVTSGNTSNMLKHLRVKHSKPIEGHISKKQRTEMMCMEAEAEAAVDDPSTYEQGTLLSLKPSTSTVTMGQKKAPLLENKYLENQPTIVTSLSSIKSFEVGGQKANEITNAIILMIAKDNCTLSTVEKKGFQKLMKAVAPMYKIPSRKCITQLIEEKYSVLSTVVRERLSSLEHICLSTDIWTDTINTKSYIGITVHYVWGETLKSATFSIMDLSERHTAQNIGEWILEILEIWHINKETIVAIVSDNASNMTKAIKNTFGEHRFLSCFAHSLNLVATQVVSDKDIREIVDKVKRIVTYFKHSVAASDELRKQKSPPMLSASELQAVKEFVKVLRPLEQSTKELCAELYISASKVIPIVNCLKNNLSDISVQTPIGKKIYYLTLSALDDGFLNIENNNMLAMASLLDPRFKSLHFKDDKELSSAISCLKNQLKVNERVEISENDPVSNSRNETDINDIWSYHNKLFADKNKTNPDECDISESMPVLLQHYLNFALSDLETDSIIFWKKEFGATYPSLRDVAIRYLPITATSVPSERLFSKAGIIMTESRNRLSSKHLHQLLFLNSLTEELFY